MLDQGVGRPASRAPADGAAGACEGSPAAAQGTGADVAAAGAVSGGDRRHAARGPGRAEEAAAHRSAGAARLVDEHGAADLSYSTVRDYVGRRRPEIAAEAGRPLEAGCVPQAHRPAAEAEVDFHDLWVNLQGIKTKTALFTMRLSFSGRAAHRASLSQGQEEAFLEAHVHAFGPQAQRSNCR